MIGLKGNYDLRLRQPTNELAKNILVVIDGAFMNHVKLGDLISGVEIKSLRNFVTRNSKESKVNVVMKWLDDNPRVTENFYKHEIIKSYGCYLLIHYLKL